MTPRFKHKHLAGDTGVLVLIVGTIAMGGIGTLFDLMGIALHLPVGLRASPGIMFAGLLAGLGLLALIQRHQGWRLGLSASLAAFALYLLVESLGFTQDHLSNGSVAQGAPAPSLLLLIALGLGGGVQGAGRGKCFKLLGDALFLTGLVSLVLDLAPMERHTWHALQQISMALPSGFFLCFGLAMRYVANHWQRFPLNLGRWHRNVAVIGATLSTLCWLLIGWQQHRVERQQASHVSDVVLLTSESVIHGHEQAMQRMAERWGVLGGLPMASLREQEVTSYFRDHPALEGLAFIGGTGDGDWLQAPDTESLSRLEAELRHYSAERSLVEQDTPLQWLLPDPDQPLKAILSVRVPNQPESQLVSRIDLDELLVRKIRPELGDYNVHLERAGQLLAEITPHAHDHEHAHDRDIFALKPLAERSIGSLGLPPLQWTIFGGPPPPWSASSLLSTGAGIGSLMLSYLLAFCVGVMRLSQARTHELDHAKRQLEEQYRVQASIAREDSHVKSLEAVCRMLEQQIPGVYSTIMLCDEKQTYFSEAIGPSLPSDFLDVLKDVPIGPDIGACGRAAYLGEMVICENLTTDVRWENYRDLVKHHRLGCCWAVPVLSSRGHLLGTLSLYRSPSGMPDDDELRLTTRVADLTALAIERHRDRQALLDSEKYHRSLFTHHPDAAYSLDLHGRIQSVNSQSESLTGLSANELLGTHFSRFVEPADLPKVQALFKSALSGRALRYEIQGRNGHGEPLVLDVTTIPMRKGEQVTGVFGIAKDITERKASEARLRTLERGIEASFNGVSIVDATKPDMPIVYVNHAFSRITGYSKDEVQGRNCSFLQGPETAPEAIQEIQRSQSAQRESQVTLYNYRKNGERFWNELRISPVRNEHGETTHFINVISDVSQRIAHEEALAYQASHDDLTGAYNRSTFEERLKHEANLARLQDKLLVVLFIDIDDFKPINDAFGHAMGDRLLATVAERLAMQLGPNDSLGRFGGDEFLVLLPRLEHEDQAQAIVDQLLAALTRPFRIDEHEFRLSASIGMASSRELVLQLPQQLIVRADSAMYKAKQQGGNTAHWYRHHIGIEPSERVELRRDIQEAIEQNQFSLHYQPLMNARGEAVGFEALIRWQHPVKGMVSPGTFIPVAEITGQIIPISDWVLGQVCRDLPALKRLGAAGCRVAVNLSPMQFQRPTFLSSLHQRLRENDVPSHWLELEVTEGVLMEDRDAAISILNALRELDISVAIDDFGTGFSSLSYLKSLPVNKIKIDRSFVRDVVTDHRDRAIVQGVISMARSMGLQVVAEGVETDEQWQYLDDQGCDIFQGYLLSKPMPLDKVEAFLTTNT